MIILSGSSHPRLTAALAKSLSAPLADRSISRFPDQTLKIRLNSDVMGEIVILVQTLIHPVHDHLIEILLLADAAKSAGATKIIAVIPYLAYSKQDQIFLPGEPLSIRVVAQILSAAPIDEIITLDLHRDHIAKFFSIPIHNLSFIPTLIHETKSISRISLTINHQSSTIIVAPDAGAVSRAQTIAEKLSLHLIIIDKSRNLITGKINIKRTLLAKQGESLKDVKGKRCLIVDDLIVTGATLVAGAKFLKAKGVAQISVFATHGIFTDGFQKLHSAGINSITISDSIPHKKLPQWIKIISLVPLLTETIKNLTKNQRPL